METKSRTLAPDYGWTNSPRYRSYTTTYYTLNDFDENYYKERDELYFLNYTNRAISPHSALNLVQTFGSTKRGKGVFNDCVNSKLYSVNHPITGHLAKSSYSYPYFDLTHHRLNYPSIMYGDMFTDAHLGVSEVNTVRRRAWYHLQPRFAARVSMLNFLFELKDFRDIAKNLGSVFTNPHLAPWSAAKKRITTAPKSGDPTKPAAEAVLLYNFGIMPFLRDMTEITAQAGIMASQAYDEFVQEGNVLQKSHYSEKLESTIEAGSNMYTHLLQLGRFRDTLFTATMQYQYDYAPRDPRDIFKKYWGLDFTWEAYWNMIPFTFLLDYVLRIGNSLHALQIDKNLDLQISQYCESLLSKSVAGYYVDDVYWDHDRLLLNQVYQPNGGTPICGLVSNRYERIKCEPVKNGLYVPKLNLPSGRQGLNCLALARAFL